RGIRFIVPGDDEWPTSLSGRAHAGPLQGRGDVPVGLWVRGPQSLAELGPSVAIVGSRSATTYGDEVSSSMAATVAAAGFTVVSGAAYGVDYAAHRGAVTADGRTVAVLACGVDRAYPVGHRQMLDYLGEHHAVVSEAPPGSAPFRIRFLARNRIIAALARGTVVVEAAVRSGALNTASWSDRLHRTVMAVPGSVFSAPSEGVHELLRCGAASLVTGGGDVLELLSEPGEHLVDTPRAPESPRDLLTVRARQVLDAVPAARAAPAASVALVAGLGLEEVEGLLQALVADGHVEQTPAGWRLGSEVIAND
ncbi:MAG TPA: DNA-processing protein DprA, partial [Acidimicrobiales bacterium]